MRTHRVIHGIVAVAALALVALTGAGCGSAGRTTASLATSTSPVVAAVAAAPTTASFLPADDVDRKIANGFRVALDRLGVMTQPPDQGVDVGQPVPTGQLRDVRCFATAARPRSAVPWRWGCRVRWAPLTGEVLTTRYAVRLQPGGCFTAGAQPARPQVRDSTAGTFSEDPLNTIVGVGKGC
jgi:hypothetical protein